MDFSSMVLTQGGLVFTGELAKGAKLAEVFAVLKWQWNDGKNKKAWLEVTVAGYVGECVGGARWKQEAPH